MQPESPNLPGDEPSKAFGAAMQVVRDLIAAPKTYLEGKAEASKIRTIAQAEADAADIKVRAEMRLHRALVEEQKNLEQIAAKAGHQLSIDVTPGWEEEPVEPEWISKFISEARHVSNEEIQNLWAKLLAGEIRQPGSFSIRFIHKLSELGGYEANCFQGITPYVWKESFVGELVVLNYTGPKFAKTEMDWQLNCLESSRRMLDDAGLLRSAANQSFERFFMDSLTYFDESFRLSFSELEVYFLTNVGRELFRLCKPLKDDEYLRCILSIATPTVSNKRKKARPTGPPH